ncbi:MAG: hypothetical protein JZD40_01780, partial [Sulfolobus sp.]|nr:hypothetical protein [Sulfolobus sp.]
QPPYQLPYLPQQQPTKERKFPIIPVIGAVVATLVILVVIVAVFPSLFSSGTYVVQPSFLSSNVGGSWHVDKNKTFTITISDFKAVVSFANGTTLTFTNETAFVEYVDSYNLNFNLGNQQSYEPTSMVTTEESVSNISMIKFEVLNSSDNQYAVALCVKFVPNSYYANELGKFVNLLPLIAGLSTINPNITAYYNSTYNAIGIEQPSFNGYYNVTVAVINVNSLKVGIMEIVINHQISYLQLEDLVNSFAKLIGS